MGVPQPFLGEQGSRRDHGVESVLRFFPRGVLACNPAGCDALSDVSHGLINMAEHGAELTNCVKSGDGPSKRVKDLLPRTVNRPSLCKSTDGAWLTKLTYSSSR